VDGAISGSLGIARCDEGANYLDVCDQVLGAEAGEAAKFATGIRSVLNGDFDRYSAEYSCHSPTERRWFVGRVTRFFDNDLPRILIEHINITARREIEETLLFKAALLEGQTETTIDGILAVDESDRIVLANKQFGRIFGVPAALLNSKDDVVVLRFVTGVVADPGAFLERVHYLNSHRDEKSRDEIALKDGKTLDRYSAPLVDSRSEYRGRIWYFRDITDRKAAEERSRFLAYHDALTGLPHRTLLLDRLDTALASARRRNESVALLFLDLDRFKNINDTFGHSFGDAVLIEVSRRLKQCSREQDTVGRLSGDEFLIILNDVKGAANAAISAERIIEAMNASFSIEGHSLSVDCSIGISMYPDHGADGETLIKNADEAMYSAKECGRGKVRFFTDQMNAEATERVAMDRDLRLALSREEFFLVYQPQVEIESGRIIGFEALIRWQHPEKGLVTPNEFISIAESSGLILPIGEFVLRRACRDAQSWQRHGFPQVPVAVNVSAVQFRQEGFLALIKRVLDDTGLAPQLLELELTESLLLSSADVTLAILRNLKAIGLKLAIDDFGTGYSNLSYLKHFPVSKIKIDRTFVRGLTVGSDDAAITFAIITMAKSLKLKVIAEGVESEEQMSLLREHRCDEIQGNYFSAPLAANELADKLLSGLPGVRSFSSNSTNPIQ